MELGAGSGALAVDLMQELERLGALPRQYFILERSAAMRALQQQAIAAMHPRLGQRVAWLDELPARPLDGVVFGNEVADALPVKRFRWRDGDVSELGVAWRDDRLSWCESRAAGELQAYVNAIAGQGGWPESYQSEYSPVLAPWIGSLADCVQRGLLLLVDYGYGRGEYYHPQRSSGTLMCHYRHRAHDDPFWYPGLQDITAFVDFTAIAEAATEAGMRLQGFTSQAQFLLACGIDELISAADPGDTRRFLRLSNEAKRLLLPSDMGDRFKVIGFARELDRAVRGFAAQDLRSRL
jgi:SAM-dependent MidA family methyltransferase